MVTLDAGTPWSDAMTQDPPLYLPPDIERPDSSGAGLWIEPLMGQSGWKVSGEIDLATRDIWRRALTQVVGSGFEVHLDLSGLTFTDVAGVALLVTAAGRLTGGRRMVVHRPPRGWLLIFDVMWPGGAPSIEVVR